MDVIYRYRLQIAVVLLALIAGGALALLLGFRPSILPLNAREVLPAPTPLGAGSPEDTGAAGDAQEATPPAPARIKVYVAGAVARPGVYTLDADARVEEAVSAAGGPAADAALEHINLAARLRDEQQITVPRRGEPTPPPAATSAASEDTASEAGVKATPSGPIDINTADAAAFQTLPSIGPVLAERIVGYRQEHGAFGRIEDLLGVPGIGPRLFERIQPYVVVR